MTVLERVDRRLANMRTMLERYGIDPVAFSMQHDGRYLAAALPACMGCRGDAACREWLDLGEERLERVPGFCPNAQLFAWAKQDQVQSDML
jgi:hypothetical protein